MLSDSDYDEDDEYCDCNQHDKWNDRDLQHRRFECGQQRLSDQHEHL